MHTCCTKIHPCRRKYVFGVHSVVDTQDALDFYGKKRTSNGKVRELAFYFLTCFQGVTIASQVRYVHYYGKYIREQLQYKSTPLLIRAVKLIGIPYFSQGTCGT